MATGYFAQFDGTLDDMSTLSEPARLTYCSDGTGTASRFATQQVTPQKPLPVSPKFKEATMQDDQPTASPTSPTVSPSKKSISPAKAKFAQIAGRAGIKGRAEPAVSKSEDQELQPQHEASSPPEKRGWRAVWKKRVTGPVE